MYRIIWKKLTSFNSWIIFSFLFCSRYVLIFIMISHLTHGFRNNLLLNFQIFGILFVSFSLLMSTLIWMWLENIIWIISALWDCCGLLYGSAWSILVNILYVLGKNGWSCHFRCNRIYQPDQVCSLCWSHLLLLVVWWICWSLKEGYIF